MKIQIIVTTPVGVFKSDLMDAEEDKESLSSLYETVKNSKISYAQIPINKCVVVFPSDIARNSVWEFKKIQ